ncbi:hypothetical protein B0H11DRAFT_2231794 [Mycena galericulata]|nr:hypothetical protein B0H11DRAFT_2231794 [Mycena galericulata]
MSDAWRSPASIQPGPGRWAEIQIEVAILRAHCGDLLRALWILILKRGHLLRSQSRQSHMGGYGQVMRSRELLRRNTETFARVAARYQEARVALMGLENSSRGFSSL